MKTSTDIYAIVPAAGHSRRMGRDKQLIDINGRPMLRAVLDTLAASSVAGVMLVTRLAILDAIQVPETIHIALNDDDRSEMIDSIRIGLRAWRDRGDIKTDVGFLICPADQPHLTAADVDHCIQAFRESPASIVIASYQGRRGHPMIFPANLADFVFSQTCDHGLNAMVYQFADRIQLVPCISPGVIKDIDCPDDL